MATDGTDLYPLSSFLHSSMFNLQFDTLRLAEQYDVTHGEILQALAAIRKQDELGYPGMPQLAVFDAIANEPVESSEKFFAAGVLFFIERALAFERQDNHAESGRYFHEAEEMYAFLRVDTGELFDQFKKIRAKDAADKRHSKPGGSRAKSEAIREIWATGKYSSRDRCAEEEAAALNMSFSTARKALRGTPDPA